MGQRGGVCRQREMYMMDRILRELHAKVLACTALGQFVRIGLCALPSRIEGSSNPRS